MLTSASSFLPTDLCLILGSTSGGGGAAFVPGDAARAASAEGAAGGAAGGAAPPPGGLPSEFIWIMLGMIVIMLVVSSLGPKKERKRREAMLSGLKKHDRVQTEGGVIGSIVEIKPDTIVLKVDESSNTRITFTRSSIQHVLSSRDESPLDVAEATEVAESR